MSAQLIDGKSRASKLRAELSEKLAHRASLGLRKPSLHVILVGDDPASHIYVQKKHEASAAIGLASSIHPLPADTSQAELKQLILNLNNDDDVDGILVQLPLPKPIDARVIINSIDPQKDVDGFHPYNIGCLVQRQPRLRPCTPYGIMHLLAELPMDLHGQHCVIVGASNIVGRPMALEMLIAGATVTVCHRFTKDLAHHVGEADILIVAIGKVGIVKSEWLKAGSIVIDVGMNRLDDGRLVGDIDFDSAKAIAGFITPVPGGVGPMTVACLMANTLYAAEQREQADEYK